MKKLIGMMLAAVLSAALCVPAFAGTWKKNSVGWWYDNGDGTWAANGWKWIDGNHDGVAECYYFDASGYLLVNTTTPDGLPVNADGQWTDGGRVVTMSAEEQGYTYDASSRTYAWMNAFIISKFLSISILFSFILSLNNFLNLQFLNTLISAILFCCKFNSYNSGKFTFLNTSIFVIELLAKFNNFNFGKLTLDNISISEI